MEQSRRTPLAVILVMAIIIVALVYGFFIRPNYHLVNGGEIFLEAIYSGKLEVRKGARIETMDDELYIATVEGLTKLTLDGEHVWNKSYHFNELLFLNEAPYLAAVDITGKEAFIFDENGQLATIKTDYGIISATLNETGYLTIVTEDNNEHYISMYDYLGNIAVKRRTVFKDDGYPVTVAMSKEATKMMTSHLYVSQHVVESVITFLDYSSDGELYTDRIVGHERMKETMVSGLHYLNNNNVVLIGDNQLIFYHIDKLPELIKSIPIHTKIMDYEVTGDSLVISFSEALTPEGENYRDKIVSFSSAGEVLAILESENTVTDLSADEETYYIIESSHIRKYKDENQIWNTTLHKDVRDIIQLSGNQFLIVYDYNYEILKIKDI